MDDDYTDDRYTVRGHFMPMPELLTHDRGCYEIIDSRKVHGLPTNGMVDQVNKQMFVPLDAGGRVVSRHECAHVLWTEPRMRGTRRSVAFLQAVEDGRINRGLRFIGLGIDLDDEHLEQVVSLGRRDLEYEAEGLVQWGLRSIASYGTNAAGPLLALVEEGIHPPLPLDIDSSSLAERVCELVKRTHEKLERAREREGGPVAASKSVPLIARWLRREFQKLGLPEPIRDGTLVCCLGAGARGAALGRRGRRRPHWLDTLPGRGKGSGPACGRLRISEPRLPHPCVTSPRGAARGRRSATEGTMLRDVSRFAHDQKVFGARSRHRRAGGSVLIDTSGSMSLSAEDIDQIIEGAPEATLVAIYSGDKADGELRVVVRDGRRIGVDGLTPYGTGNVVDLPALEWLAKQKKPRVIVSDGGYTGVNDESSRTIRIECERVCRSAGIARVENAAQAAKVLTRGR